MKKILICIFGVVGRSIKYTWSSINRNIINKLKKDYNIDILVINNNINPYKCDKTIINNEDYKIIPYTFYKEYKQDEIDENIKLMNINSEFYPNNAINSIRHLYLEFKVAEYIEQLNNNYDYIVITNSDYYYTSPFNINHIHNINDNIILTAVYLDNAGITDGFYIGKQKDIIKILSRINNIKELHTYHNDKFCKCNPCRVANSYEYNLLKAFKLYNITRHKDLGLGFVKIRADLSISPNNIKGSHFFIINKFINELIKYDTELLKKVLSINNFIPTELR